MIILLQSIKKKYKFIIGRFLYLIGTRPDIMHVLGIVGRFQANPKETDLQAVKSIFKYLQGTQYFGLWCTKDVDFVLHAYKNADWEGNIDDREVLVEEHFIWDLT